MRRAVPSCTRARPRARAAANFANFQLEQPSGSAASVEEPATAGRPVAEARLVRLACRTRSNPFKTSAVYALQSDRMIRREFLRHTAAATLVSAFAATNAAKLVAQPASSATRWQIHGSEGLDAIGFTGALSGGELYLQYYGAEAAEFAPKLPQDVRTDLADLRTDAEKSGFGLLWPTLALIFSGIELPTIEQVIAAAAEPERLLRSSFRSSRYWDEKNWAWFTAAAPRLRKDFEAIRDAGFAQFRSRLAGNRIETQSIMMSKVLSGFDVIQWQRKLTGRKFDPEIDIALLYFSKPHGVRVQGQRFLQSLEYSPNTTARIAAHEMLHPSIDKNGAVGKAALAQLARDPLIGRIVKEHDPRWGYTSLEGYMDEDLCQALDQLIDEELGIAHNPAERWHDSDDGMHVLAAGLYGLLRHDRWTERGGSIDDWLMRAVKAGRLQPRILHPAAAEVLDRPAARLWPLAKVNA